MKASVRRNSEYYSGAGRGVPAWEDRRKQLSGSDNTAGDQPDGRCRDVAGFSGQDDVKKLIWKRGAISAWP
jgi:hypothetical protein